MLFKYKNLLTISLLKVVMVVLHIFLIERLSNLTTMIVTISLTITVRYPGLSEFILKCLNAVVTSLEPSFEDIVTGSAAYRDRRTFV